MGKINRLKTTCRTRFPRASFKDRLEDCRLMLEKTLRTVVFSAGVWLLLAWAGPGLPSAQVLLSQESTQTEQSPATSEQKQSDQDKVVDMDLSENLPWTLDVSATAGDNKTQGLSTGISYTWKVDKDNNLVFSFTPSSQHTSLDLTDSMGNVTATADTLTKSLELAVSWDIHMTETIVGSLGLNFTGSNNTTLETSAIDNSSFSLQTPYNIKGVNTGVTFNSLWLDSSLDFSLDFSVDSIKTNTWTLGTGVSLPLFYGVTCSLSLSDDRATSQETTNPFPAFPKVEVLSTTVTNDSNVGLTFSGPLLLENLRWNLGANAYRETNSTTTNTSNINFDLVSKYTGMVKKESNLLANPGNYLNAGIEYNF